MTSGMREWVKRLAAVGGGLAVALLGGEGALRLVVPTYSAITFDLFYRTPDGQLRLQPGSRRRHLTPEWAVRVETNGAGFRDTDDPPLPGQPVLLGLGDSLTFGWGVEYEEAFLSRLEASLGGPRGGVRVIKAAIPGTGPTDYLELVRKLLPALQPAVVLLGFYVGNDFTDVAEGGAAQFEVVDGLLVRRGEGSSLPLVERLKSWLKRKSYLAQLAASQLWLIERRRAAAVPVARRGHPALAAQDYWLREFIQVHLAVPPPPRLQEGIDRTFETLAETRRLATAHGARFVLAAIPRSIQIYDVDRERYEEAFGVRAEEWDMDRPQRLLGEWAASEGVEFLDLLPALRGTARLGSDRLYYFPDSHLTAAGHRAIARELTRYFSRAPIIGRAKGLTP